MGKSSGLSDQIKQLDGFTGNFYHMYGVGLNPGSKYATYAFDNFIIRVP